MSISFDNTYAKLPERFYSPETPTAVRAPELIRVNHALAKHLGIDPLWLESDAGIAVLAGNTVELLECFPLQFCPPVFKAIFHCH